MTSSPPSLREILVQFAEMCGANERLAIMNRDWFRTVAIEAEEGERVSLRYDGGPVTVLTEPDRDPDLVVEGPEAILRDVFSGRRPPTEPYLAGDLRVRGSQDDVMRLDIITLLIWGE